MKKICLLLMIGLLLVGCHSSASSQTLSYSKEEFTNGKIYQYLDMLLCVYEDDNQKGFHFQFELNQSGIGDYASYVDASHQKATCYLSHQENCQLVFTLDNDSILVEANEEEDYLSANLSGKYILQGDVE